MAGEVTSDPKLHRAIDPLDEDLFDPHTSFTNRQGTIFEVIELVCADPELTGFCNLYHDAVDPHLPVPIKLNTAGDEDIRSIPGVGARMLREFKEYRPYRNIEQFRREIGKYVNEKEVSRLERYVTLN